jgi:hypothetical protein
MNKEFYKGIHDPLGNQREHRNNERNRSRSSILIVCRSPAHLIHSHCMIANGIGSFDRYSHNNAGK